MSGKSGRSGAKLWWAACAVFLCAGAACAASQQKDQLVTSSEIEGRRVLVPPDLLLDLAWYAPEVKADAGKIVRGWVKEDLILLETDRNNLICVRREDGTERWRCVLDEPLRYEPAVSRNNVVVNIKNFLVAIEKRTGDVRWKLFPEFLMSNAPLIIDPPTFPKDYSVKYQNMESIYVGSWEGRFHALAARGRMATYVKGRDSDSSLAAPEFDLFPLWHKTHAERGVISNPIRVYDEWMYYAADDRKVYSVNRNAEIRDPYVLQGQPCTAVSVNSVNCYVGTRDFSVIALDRLTLRKKWVYTLGTHPTGTILADEPGEQSYVFVTTETQGVHALRVQRATGGARGTLVVPETFEPAWKMPDAEGAVAASEQYVYLGFGHAKSFDGYQRVACVAKDTGQTAWKSESQGVRFYLQFHNAWKRPDQALRLYAVTEDNRLLSFKEKTADAGPLVEKPAAPAEGVPAAPKKAKGQPLAKPEGGQ